MADKTKPEIDFIEGDAPTELVITDLEVGDGSEATPGATVDVHYVGVDFETGEEFDSSWGRGQSIQFPLNGLGGDPRHEGRRTPSAGLPARLGLRSRRRRPSALGSHAGLRDRSAGRQVKVPPGTLEA